jgi:hypothetical protein
MVKIKVECRKGHEVVMGSNFGLINDGTDWIVDGVDLVCKTGCQDWYVTFTNDNGDVMIDELEA